MNLEMYATEIVTVVLIGLVLLLIAAAFHCGHKRARILAAVSSVQEKGRENGEAEQNSPNKLEIKKTEADMVKAIEYEIAERLCIGIACALYIFLLANINHRTLVDGLQIIIQKLEDLATNG